MPHEPAIPNTLKNPPVLHFQSLPSAPFAPRTDHKTCAYSPYALLCIGGEHKGNTMYNDVYKFIPALREWVNFSELTPSEHNFSPRNSVGCFIRDDRLHLFGGFEMDKVSMDFNVSNELGTIRVPGADNDEMEIVHEGQDSSGTGTRAGSNSLKQLLTRDLSRYLRRRNSNTHSGSTTQHQETDCIQFQKQLFKDMNGCPAAFKQGVFGGTCDYWRMDDKNTYLVTAFGCGTVWNEDNKIGGVYAYHFESNKWEVWDNNREATTITTESGLTPSGTPLSRYAPLSCLHGDYLYVLGGRRAKDLRYVFTNLCRFKLRGSSRERKWEVLRVHAPIPLSKEYKTMQSVLVGDVWYILSTPPFGDRILSAYHMKRDDFAVVGKVEGLPVLGRYSLDYVDSDPHALYAMCGYELNEFSPSNNVYRIELRNPWGDEKEKFRENLRKDISRAEANRPNFADILVCTAEE